MNNKGRLIVIEGVDASGKATQTECLYRRLLSKGQSVTRLSFPDYQSPASAPVKMYLSGEFGHNPADVNAYAASVLFAVDRFASYKKKWQHLYEGGELMLCDRYTTSNAIHQGAKLSEEDREGYFKWLFELEFERMGMPRPDLVLFLDMPPELSLSLMEGRLNKATGEGRRDIHEANPSYIYASAAAGRSAARIFGWKKISCVDHNGALKSVDDISDEIWSAASGAINLEGR